jgi:hypothetical protein
MQAEDWISEERVADWRRAVKVRRAFTRFVLLLSFVTIILSSLVAEADEPWRTLPLRLAGLVFLGVAVYMIHQTFVYNSHMNSLIDRQETELKADTERLFAELDRNLGEK